MVFRLMMRRIKIHLRSFKTGASRKRQRGTWRTAQRNRAATADRTLCWSGLDETFIDGEGCAATPQEAHPGLSVALDKGHCASQPGARPFTAVYPLLRPGADGDAADAQSLRGRTRCQGRERTSIVDRRHGPEGMIRECPARNPGKTTGSGEYVNGMAHNSSGMRSWSRVCAATPDQRDG